MLPYIPLLALAVPTLSAATAGAIPGNYGGILRPQIHYSPPVGFMNDPNGLHIDDKGLYHLYYQYNPNSTVAGNQHWGHATSPDGYHWTNQAIAISPDSADQGIFSGSAVVDTNNTSGLFPTGQTNGVVAIYTLNVPTSQTQHIAYSSDGGYTFTKYKGNPVLVDNSTEFRDPKVVWHAPTQKWVMVVSYAQAYVIGIFTSPNLINWSHASNFSHAGLTGLQYECPNLVEMPMLLNYSAPEPLAPSNIAPEGIWSMFISINPGAPLGGSITEHFPGTFNGTHFTAFDASARITDFAKDNYAGQFFYGIPATQPQIHLDWASNWDYSQKVPTGYAEGFRSAMSSPRMAALANVTTGGFQEALPYQLVSFPSSNITSLYTSAANAPLLNVTGLKDNSTKSLSFDSTVSSRALHIKVQISNLTASSLPSSVDINNPVLSILLSSPATSSTQQSLLIGFQPAQPSLYVSRMSSSISYPDITYNPLFTSQFSTGSMANPETGLWDMEIVLDRSLLEVYAQNGARMGTVSYFAGDEGLGMLNVEQRGFDAVGAKINVQVYGLKGTWCSEGGAL